MVTAKEIAEMKKMRDDGATLREIGEKHYMSPPRVSQLIKSDHIRGRGFNINRIIYQGIYEHFVNTPKEHAGTFARKIHKNCDDDYSTKMRYFLLGEHTARYSISDIKRICEIVGKPFEETFAPRKVEVTE